MNPATNETTSVRILLVDDHAIIRSGLKMLIESRRGLRIVGEASDRAGAVALATSERPDIILLDLDLGSESGLDLIPPLRDAAAQARILVLTGLRDTEVHRSALRLGAMGIVQKEMAGEVLLKAIQKVHAGEAWLDRSSIANLLSEIAEVDAGRPDPEAARIAALSPREREVITLIGEGLNNKKIAERLKISETTVRHHLTSIFAKLGVSDRLELLVYAYKNRLAGPVT
jgi:two-component system nitrate/nitrite response regulator NarL